MTQIDKQYILIEKNLVKILAAKREKPGPNWRAPITSRGKKLFYVENNCECD